MFWGGGGGVGAKPAAFRVTSFGYDGSAVLAASFLRGVFFGDQ